MDNRGKHWPMDHDQMLMENPQWSNAHFSQLMGRSENAIRFRRSHLAVKMHLQRPDTPLAECVILMGGDHNQAEQMLEEWTHKRACFNAFLDTRKRKAEDHPMPQALPSPVLRQSQNMPASHATKNQAALREAFSAFSSTGRHECIRAICKCIKEENGNISSIWEDPDFAPFLVQHYDGFEAYARHVQARTGL
jgi:hypothetical protein